LALGLLAWLASIGCLWQLVTPSVRWLPTTRHNVVSLDISGASKSIRFVRTNVGSYIPAIYTPKTEKTTIQTSTKSKLQKLDGGTIKVTSDVVSQDRFTYNGLYHKTVLDAFELDLAGAICYGFVCWFVVKTTLFLTLLRSDNTLTF